MEKTEIIETTEGVIAELNGKFWGTQHEDEQYKQNDFGNLKYAKICDPKFCKKPTDMTYDPENVGGFNPDYDKLKKAQLIKIKKTIITKFEIIK